MYTTYAAYPEALEFRSSLRNWLKNHSRDVVYLRRPSIAFGMPHAVLQARIFYALEAIGRGDLHEKLDLWVLAPQRDSIYHRIWDPDENAILALTDEFAVASGIPKDVFERAYHSTSTEQHLRSALSASAWAKMDGSPTFVIDGRFSVSAHRLAYPQEPPTHEDYDRLLRLIDYLVKYETTRRMISKR